MSRHIYKSRKELLKHCIMHLLKNSRSKIWWKYFFVSDILSRILFRGNYGCYILEEDWDNLIILDACRFDIFSKEIKNYNIKGELQYRTSRGCFTTQFLLENFKNIDGYLKEQLENIVYVTANPYVDILFRDVFHKIVSVWNFGWDENLKTVPPNIVYMVAVKTVSNNLNKRIIIHFMQPHEPFVNFKTPSGCNTTGFSKLREAILFEKKKNISRDTSIWETVEKGHLRLEDAIKAYVENLRWVLPYAVRLCKILPGKTVITSDHGEAFGEKIHPLIPIKIYGHHNARIEPLIKVPWFISGEHGSLDKLEKEVIRTKISKLRRNI